MRHDMSLFKALYGNINRFCRVNTLALTHRRRKSKNKPISNAISDKDIDDIKTLRMI